MADNELLRELNNDIWHAFPRVYGDADAGWGFEREVVVEFPKYARTWAGFRHQMETCANVLHAHRDGA